VNTVVAGQYHLPIKSQPVVPNELLKRAVLQLETMLAKKNGSVEWELEPKNVRLNADEENLYLAFYNIINNAIKYSVTPKVIIHTFSEDGLYHIIVKDNGPGIEPAHQKKIFQKFYRAQNGNIHAVKGLGLGLYFTRKVVEAHSGTIRVSSIPGIGTNFIMQLPINTT
jgi:two-component system phosphate regulon sensor histidine kinase PhoR